MSGSHSSELELLDSVQKILPKVRRLLQKRIQEFDEKGITPNFRFSDLDENRLLGCLRFETEDAIKGKLLSRHKFNQFLNDMEWKTFENLCVYIIKLYDFRKYDVSKRIKDGGLDFFGFYEPKKVIVTYKGFFSNMNLRFFGEAKHRNKTSVSEGEILKFHSQYRDFLHKQGRAYSFVNNKAKWFLDTKGPLIPLFFTNNSFSKNAKNYADRYGIIIRDGEQLVEDIIRLSKSEPWFTLEKNNKLKFHSDKFKNFLKNISKKKL